MLKKTVLLIFFVTTSAFAQNILQEGQKRWNKNQKLTINDFKIKISDENSDAVYSQFMILHAIRGFDFMKKNLNRKIENIFLGTASWIDTTKVNKIEKQIEFQQMQFDISEIYARKFRKRVLQNKKKIKKGFNIISQINNNIITEFSLERLELVKETQGGRDEQKLLEWKEKIASELDDLNEFRFENKNKIILSN